MPFSGDEDTTTIDLFLTLYVDPEKGDKLSDKDLDKHFNWLLRFYDQFLSGSIYSKIEDNKSDLKEVADLINKTDKIARIRLFILTNDIVSLDYEKRPTELEIAYPRIS